MPQIDLEQELGEISRECSIQLLKNFSKLDILPWPSWGKNDDRARGSFQFLRYAPLDTCFRTLPDAPRRFQEALKSGLLSGQEASEVLAGLLGFLSRMLPLYNGGFSAEIHRTVGPIIRRAVDLQRHGLPFERDFSPDEIYSLIPWPCRPSGHFATPVFRPIAVRQDLVALAKQPYMAICLGIDAVCVGPSGGLSAADITRVLNLLEGKALPAAAFNSAGDLMTKIVLPSIIGGFQGVTFGNFVNLSDAQQQRVPHHLYQFGETVGQKCEEIRQRKAERILDQQDGLHDVVRAFLTVLPPTEHIQVMKGREAIGLKLAKEGEYWAGYSTISKRELESLGAEEHIDEFLVTVRSDQFRVRVKVADELTSLDPVLMRFRMRSNLSKVTSSLGRDANMPVLRRSDVLAVVESLERQIADGVKPQLAAKALYLFDEVLKNYEFGEARLHNDGCRKYMEEKLEQSDVTAYQLVGKAFAAYQKLIKRFIQETMQFEPTGAILRVRWTPLKDHTT
jgi:hypothetical protein